MNTTGIGSLAALEHTHILFYSKGISLALYWLKHEAFISTTKVNVRSRALAVFSNNIVYYTFTELCLSTHLERFPNSKKFNTRHLISNLYAYAVKGRQTVMSSNTNS